MVDAFKELMYWGYVLAIEFGKSGEKLFTPLVTINGQSFSIISIFSVSALFILIEIAFAKWIFSL